MPRKKIIIEERFSVNGSEELHNQREELFGKFTLNLPYYEDAATIVFTHEGGTEVLKISLDKYTFAKPEIRNTCGDGVCSDKENLIMCYKD